MNNVEYVERPEFNYLYPPVIPFGKDFVVRVDGKNFMSDYSYKCIYDFPPFEKW